MDRPLLVEKEWKTEKSAQSIAVMAVSGGTRKGAMPYSQLSDLMAQRIKGHAYLGLNQVIIRAHTKAEAIQVCEALATLCLKRLGQVALRP